VYSLEGKVIADVPARKMDKGDQQLRVAIPSQLPAGLYIYRLNLDEKTTQGRVLKE
jgi:hypothetical protein